jgi:hypothetical protein
MHHRAPGADHPTAVGNGLEAEGRHVALAQRSDLQAQSRRLAARRAQMTEGRQDRWGQTGLDGDRDDGPGDTQPPRLDLATVECRGDAAVDDLRDRRLPGSRYLGPPSFQKIWFMPGAGGSSASRSSMSR